MLVHSGSAIGGHYYAYIKSFDDQKWYNYNDSTVTPITLEDVTKVFGDGRGSSTAYMLKYRQYNPTHREAGQSISDDIIPAYLKAEIDADTDKMIDEQKQIEERLYAIKLKVHPESNFTQYDDKAVKEVSVRKDTTLRDVA